MCGIAGIFDAKQHPKPAELVPMVSIQRHRGPDAEGHMTAGPIAMGMRRLSIIDVSGGDQPVFNEDGSVGVVFNGEIYNYLELREDLIARGHTFRTQGDTEVLVHLYEESGLEMLPRLNGMFAFSLWDAKSKRLVLARDRMGVKPLFYTRKNSRWYFASELKCLFTQTELRDNLDLDLDALADFLRLGYIPRQESPYAGVRKLLPGHSLVIDENGGREYCWWNLADFTDPDASNSGELLRELENLFDDSVKLRMRSDVPVASFLSGGLDSSLVTITAQRYSGIPMNTYTLGFEHTEFDETPYAQAVVDQEHTRHHVQIARTRDALNLLPRLLWHMDEPHGDCSIIPNFLISRFAAQNVKVCLSGLGGDELFGGYQRYQDAAEGRTRKVFKYVPTAAGLLAPLVDPWSHSHAEELRIASSAALDWRSYLQKLQILDSRALQNLGFPALGQTESIIEELWNRFPGTDRVSRRQFVDQHVFLPDCILALTDRMSMANGLEVRVPFMDYRIVRLSQLLNGQQKQTPEDFKIFLKEALGKRCPPQLLTRPKWGFSTPLKNWVSQPEVFACIQGLDSGECVRTGLLNAAAVRHFTHSLESVRNSARKVWNLLVLEIWMRLRGRQVVPTESLEELLEVPVCARL